MDLFDKCNSEGGSFAYFRLRDDEYYTMPVLEPEPGREMTYNGKKVIQWSINNYLGLAENEEIKKVAVEAARRYGSSAPMGSRMMTGTTERHKLLERELADYLQKEDAILFNYGYLGVLGTLGTIVGPDDTIVLDKLSHASMVDGTMGAPGKFRVFKHNDMDSLESHLKRINRDRKGGVLIVTEGVYGMQGDLADLKNITALKEKYDARLFIDDAHGFGSMGEHGMGTASHYGVHDKVDLYFGTFAKSFASIGGVTAARADAVKWLRYNMRTQIFAKSLPMIYVESLLKTLELVRTGDDRRAKLFENARKLKEGLRNIGYTVGEVPSAITPVYVPAGDLEMGTRIIRCVREKGVFITGVVYPVVPKGILLFRMIPTASHTDEDIACTLEVFKAVRDEQKLDLSSGPKIMAAGVD